MLKFVFYTTFLFCALTSGFYQKSWFDDIDGPNFLRGAGEQQIQNDKKLDSINGLPEDLKRDARDEIITTATSIKESIVCDTTAHPNKTKTTRWDNSKTPIIPDFRLCETEPYPTMVKLDSPSDVSFLPERVPLHRCVGICPSTSQFQNCTVISQEEIVLQVTAIIGTSPSIQNITVYNHTQCGCACMTRKSDCNETIHDYKPSSCKCECKPEHQSSCNTTTHTWNPKECKCQCKTAQKICESYKNQEWNPEICDCDCKERVKRRCHRKKKVLNKATCECECPTSLPCPTGTTLLKFNCTCVDNSVITK